MSHNVQVGFSLVVDLEEEREEEKEKVDFLAADRDKDVWSSRRSVVSEDQDSKVVYADDAFSDVPIYSLPSNRRVHGRAHLAAGDAPAAQGDLVNCF